jgi:hypothetical protein
MRAFFQKRWVSLAVVASVFIATVASFGLMGEKRQEQFFEAPIDVYPAGFFITGWAMVLLVIGILRAGGERQRAIMASMACLMFSTVFTEPETVTGSTILFAVLCIAMISYTGLGRFTDKARDGSDRS